MSVKFKIGFTVPAETLFGMMAKFLPIEDLHVEEVIDHPHVKQATISKIEKPRKKYSSPFKHASGKPLTDLVVEWMGQNPKQIYAWRDMSKFAVEMGFNKSSINNAATRLLHQKQIQKVGPGKYRLVENITKKAG